MIEQQNVETVVMLTNVVEEGVVKCAQYWPCCGQTVRTLGHLLLQTVEEVAYVHYTIRSVGEQIRKSENLKRKPTSWTFSPLFCEV